jgi:hypothetical protein
VAALVGLGYDVRIKLDRRVGQFAPDGYVVRVHSGSQFGMSIVTAKGRSVERAALEAHAMVLAKREAEAS